MTMTIIPILGLFVAIMIFKKKFILDEKKMAEIGEELRERYEAANQEALNDKKL